MDFGVETQVIGAIIIALTSIFALFKYFSDHIKEQNSIYQKINENLIKNTMAIDNLNNYIKTMENEVKTRLEKHEQRLDEHHDQIHELRSEIKRNKGESE